MTPIIRGMRNLELTTTPQVIVLDTREGFDQTKVVYRGQVNGMWFGGGTAEGKQNYLADALASFVKGEKPRARRNGCLGLPDRQEAPRAI